MINQPQYYVCTFNKYEATLFRSFGNDEWSSLQLAPLERLEDRRWTYYGIAADISSRYTAQRVVVHKDTLLCGPVSLAEATSLMEPLMAGLVAVHETPDPMTEPMYRLRTHPAIVKQHKRISIAKTEDGFHWQEINIFKFKSEFMRSKEKLAYSNNQPIYKTNGPIRFYTFEQIVALVDQLIPGAGNQLLMLEV